MTSGSRRILPPLRLPKMTPEDRLLVLCARLNLDDVQHHELNSLLAGRLDWDQVLHKSRGHQVSALLHRHLANQGCRDHIPAGVRDQFKAAYLTNVARNLFYQVELRRALDALRAQDIPVIVLKGAALAESVYGDVGLRPMADLDLLVPEKSVYSAQAIVRDLGYRPTGTPEQQNDTEKHHRHLPGLMGVGKPVLFEIHRHVVRRDMAVHFDIAGFWSRAQQVWVAGTKTWALAPEDLLVHLSLNFFLDRRFGSMMALRQLCDIAETTHFYVQQIDWTSLTQGIANPNLRSAVFYGLFLARQILRAQIPDRALHQLQPADFRSKETERLVRRRVFGDKWLAKPVIAPGRHNWRTISLATLRGLFPIKRKLADLYDAPLQSKRVSYLYLVRWAQALARIAKAATNPWASREDFAVDSWLYSLYGRSDERAPTERIKEGQPDSKPAVGDQLTTIGISRWNNKN